MHLNFVHSEISCVVFFTLFPLNNSLCPLFIILLGCGSYWAASFQIVQSDSQTLFRFKTDRLMGCVRLTLMDVEDNLSPLDPFPHSSTLSAQCD